MSAIGFRRIRTLGSIGLWSDKALLFDATFINLSVSTVFEGYFGTRLLPQNVPYCPAERPRVRNITQQPTVPYTVYPVHSFPDWPWWTWVCRGEWRWCTGRCPSWCSCCGRTPWGASTRTSGQSRRPRRWSGSTAESASGLCLKPFLKLSNCLLESERHDRPIRIATGNSYWGK